MNIKEMLQKKDKGFYVGLASVVLALITLIIYLAMDSMYFTPLVVVGLLVGIAVFFVGAFLNNTFVTAVSYVCYQFALYHFLVLEVNYRMDILVDTGVKGLDAIFIVAVVFFLLSIVAGIVGSCMKQEKE
ncbi:MAG: hypothetical protein J6D37_02460 [Clostridia bacterium]|nr:hypothetical protein [Clostridia bacterium]